MSGIDTLSHSMQPCLVVARSACQTLKPLQALQVLQLLPLQAVGLEPLQALGQEPLQALGQEPLQPHQALFSSNSQVPALLQQLVSSCLRPDTPV